MMETKADLLAHLQSVTVRLLGAPYDAAPNDQDSKEAGVATYGQDVLYVANADGDRTKGTATFYVMDEGREGEQARYKEGGRKANYDPDSVRPSTSALLYAGRQALYSMRDNGVPVPAAPSEELPIDCQEPEWHGQTITKVRIKKDSHSVAGVAGTVIDVWLSTTGKVTCFVWVNEAGLYVVDGYGE